MISLTQQKLKKLVIDHCLELYCVAGSPWMGVITQEKGRQAAFGRTLSLVGQSKIKQYFLNKNYSIVYILNQSIDTLLWHRIWTGFFFFYLKLKAKQIFCEGLGILVSSFILYKTSLYSLAIILQLNVPNHHLGDSIREWKGAVLHRHSLIYLHSWNYTFSHDV